MKIPMNLSKEDQIRYFEEKFNLQMFGKEKENFLPECHIW